MSGWGNGVKTNIDALEAFEDWLDHKVAWHISTVKQTVKRRDPRKLAIARRKRMLERENAKLPLFREPVPSTNELTIWYAGRDSPKRVRSFYDRINRAAFLRAWDRRQEVAPRLTEEQFAALVAMRPRVYPSGMEYAAEFWRRVLCALEFCPEPLMATRQEFWGWLMGQSGNVLGRGRGQYGQ